MLLNIISLMFIFLNFNIMAKYKFNQNITLNGFNIVANPASGVPNFPLKRTFSKGEVVNGVQVGGSQGVEGIMNAIIIKVIGATRTNGTKYEGNASFSTPIHFLDKVSDNTAATTKSNGANNVKSTIFTTGNILIAVVSLVIIFGALKFTKVI